MGALQDVGNEKGWRPEVAVQKHLGVRSVPRCFTSGNPL